jgi:carboxymethylenebutenolidase
MTGPLSNAYLAVPRSGKGPGVLVLHAWWGLNDFFRDVCDRLAGEGFVALAPDLYSGRLARTIDEAERIVSQFQEAQVVPPIVLSAVEALSQRATLTPQGLGTVGFSMGGFWALWLSQQKPDLIRAVTLFYATDGGSGDYLKSKAAYLGHFAETDPYETGAGIKALETSLRGAGRPTTFHIYPETGHWFFENDRREAYDALAAQLAWDRTLAFLRAQLDSLPS